MFLLRASYGFGLGILIFVMLCSSESAVAQNQTRGQKEQQTPPEPPSADVLQALAATRDELRKSVEDLKSKPELGTRDGAALLADVCSGPPGPSLHRTLPHDTCRRIGH